MLQALRKVPIVTDVNSDQQNSGLQASLDYDRATAERDLPSPGTASAHARMEIPAIATSRRARPQYLPREGNCTEAAALARGVFPPDAGREERGEAWP